MVNGVGIILCFQAKSCMFEILCSVFAENTRVILLRQKIRCVKLNTRLIRIYFQTTSRGRVQNFSNETSFLVIMRLWQAEIVIVTAAWHFINNIAKYSRVSQVHHAVFNRPNFAGWNAFRVRHSPVIGIQGEYVSI